MEWEVNIIFTPKMRVFAPLILLDNFRQKILVNFWLFDIDEDCVMFSTC